MMKTDYLYGTNYRIYQPEEMYHFNSDTEFLGRMIEADRNDTLLDIGTCTGALLLYASLHTRHLTGVDLFEEVCTVARDNLAMNGVEAEIVAGRIQDFVHAPFDVIICNPPYFATKNDALKNDNPYRLAARHEDYLPLHELFASVKRLLKEDGTFYMVHRASRMEEIVSLASQHQLYLSQRRIAFDKPGGIEKSCVLAFSMHKGEVKDYKPAFMNDRDSFAIKEIV